MRRRTILKGLAAGAGGIVAGGPAGAFTTPELSGADRLFPVEASGGMVVSREAEATRVGVAVLETGGNAVDAAVATAFALAVTLPQAGNLGGGGFALVHDVQNGSNHALDFGKLPQAARIGICSWVATARSTKHWPGIPTAQSGCQGR